MNPEDRDYWQADSDARADEDALQQMIEEADREAASSRAGEAARASTEPEEGGVDGIPF